MKRFAFNLIIFSFLLLSTCWAGIIQQIEAVKDDDEGDDEGDDTPTVHPAMKIGERVNGVEQSIDVDAILELSVDTSGIPSAEITWFLPSGQPLVESKRITIESSNGVSTLTVRDMLPSESGVYTVEAQNGVGKGFADFRVNVQEGVDFL